MTDVLNKLRKALERAQQSRHSSALVHADVLLAAVRELSHAGQGRAINLPESFHWTRRVFMERCEKRWADGETKPHLMHVIADCNSLRPLEPGQQFTVHFGNEAYTITRDA